MDIDNITSIDINETAFWYLTKNQRRFLVYHELSHDIFNLEHHSTPIMTTPMPGYIDQVMIEIMIDRLINHLKDENKWIYQIK